MAEEFSMYLDALRNQGFESASNHRLQPFYPRKGLFPVQPVHHGVTTVREPLGTATCALHNSSTLKHCTAYACLNVSGESCVYIQAHKVESNGSLA